MRTFKERLAADEIIRVFALGRMVQPLMVEMFGLAGGYHGLWIDQEHVTHSTPELSSVALAARANEFDSFVRMAPTGYTAVTQALEAGMGGVMAAQIHTADQAAEFLEKIYTGRFKKQRTGTLRYGIACDETGVIIEDGVVARLAEDHFYLSATSSGAAASRVSGISS